MQQPYNFPTTTSLDSNLLPSSSPSQSISPRLPPPRQKLRSLSSKVQSNIKIKSNVQTTVKVPQDSEIKKVGEIFSVINSSRDSKAIVQSLKELYSLTSSSCIHYYIIINIIIIKYIYS